MYSNNKKILAFLVLITIIVVCLLGIILLGGIENTKSTNEIIDKIVEESSWPIEDVPIFYHEGMEIEKDKSGIWYISVDSGVMYQDVRNYLIKLYEEGFEANKKTGSQNPKLLRTSLSENSGYNLFWQGDKLEEYTIRTYWAKDGAVDEFNVPYGYNFKLILNKNIRTNELSGDVDNLDIKESDGDIVVEDEGIDEISGEVSEDMTMIDNSGEILEDIIQ